MAASLSLQSLTVKALSLKQRVRVLSDKTEGEWKTINGRHVLVGKGETPLEALNKSLGKSGGVEGISKEWATANTPSEKDLSKLEGLSKTVLSDLGIKKEAVPFGQCAVTCTTMWDRLGQPKSVVPTSVMVGEDEPVILFNRKEGWALDPTGRQYDYPFFTRWANDSSQGLYKSFHRLTKVELTDARAEVAPLLAKKKIS